MGRPDQWVKMVMTEETPALTRNAARFEVPPEVATTELQLDGLLQTSRPSTLRTLAAPWPLLRREAVFEVKMPGDHVEPEDLQRSCFRREARQAQRFAAARKAERTLDPAPEHCAAWVLAPHVPRWLHAWARTGRLALTPAGVGCWWVRPAMFPVLWIAANELPLREELIPLLTARSGNALLDFAVWVEPRRSPDWLAKMVRSLPEVAKMIHAIEPDMTPKQFAEVIAGLKRSRMGQMMIDEGLGPIAYLFARRLGRPLETLERAELRRRLDTLGAARIGDAVLDLAPDALAAWLADPHAT